MAVNGIEIKVGQRWKTRDGRMASISACAQDGRPRIVHVWEGYANGRYETWSDSGRYNECAALDCALDLVELISDGSPVGDDYQDVTFHALPVVDAMGGEDLERIREDRGDAPVAPAVKVMILTGDPATRKAIPITTGVLDYFPLAMAEVARISKIGNDQHNPGQPLHWDRTKSLDHADCIARHLIDRGSFDTDGCRHSAKLAWRALAALQTELELEAEARSKAAA